MSNAAQQAAPEVNPIEQLQHKFNTFSKLYQAMIDLFQEFPVDMTNKVLIFHDFQCGFNHLEKYLGHVAAQMAQPKIVPAENAAATVAEVAAASDPAEPVTAA